MRALPLSDPGEPDTRSSAAFVRWLARGQRASLAGGMVFGIVWMCGQAATPFVVGQAINAGIVRRDTHALLDWAAVLLGIGLVQAAAGITRHRFAVTNWLVATYRIEQLLARATARLGGSLVEQVDLGDAVGATTTDALAIGAALDVTARASGSIVSFAAVAVVMLATSVELGLVVLIGVPLLMLAIGPLLQPLHHRQTRLRASVAQLAHYGADTVAGLRVLRGVGGEAEFVARYREHSQQVRRAGVAVAAVESLLDAAQVLLPGAFVVAVSWLGARLALEHRLTVGGLVSFYGYAAFLIGPMKVATEAADKFTRASVGARRVLRILTAQPTLADPPPGERLGVPAGLDLRDTTTGFAVQQGEFVCVAAVVPEQASTLADRLGRHRDPAPGRQVLLGGVPLRRLALRDVRDIVLVSDRDPRLFSGRLRDQLDPHHVADDEQLAAAIDAAAAADALDSVPDGLSGVIDERARALSGGQRQRLVLTRALLADPPILVLDEPTSAVDAHTEAHIAQALRTCRAGRTTIVATTSPLLLDRAERVVLLVDDRVVASGTHRGLLRGDARYRELVARADETAPV